MHKHRSIKSQNRPFAGTAPGAHENPAAHGNVAEHQSCTCGAERVVNRNGAHTEMGAWSTPLLARDTSVTLPGGARALVTTEGDVLAWDSVACHYTRLHRMSARQITLARTLAARASAEGRRP